jgi:hypothetical protein
MIRKQKEGLIQKDSKKTLLDPFGDKSPQTSMIKDDLKKSQSTK